MSSTLRLPVFADSVDNETWGIWAADVYCKCILERIVRFAMDVMARTFWKTHFFFQWPEYSDKGASFATGVFARPFRQGRFV